ncbi:zinc finger protein 809-like [Labrus mixtus]|uniref:zinc finger protein 809-like n=1 Tax=Labrus mixtus TaxID=508554 RepID=UPI0029C0BBAF|nr:zinc finger protein 809-like [Labrus mixtus]
MEAVNLFESSVNFMDFKLSKTELLRGIVTEKLTTAAREIFAVVERTVSGYEEEAAGLRQEIDRQRIQLEAILQPRVSLCRIDESDDDEDEGGELRDEEEQQTHVDASDSWGDFVPDEDEGEDEGGEESAEDPVRSSSLDPGSMRDPGPQRASTSGRCLKSQSSTRAPINLKVYLLQDAQDNAQDNAVSEHAVDLFQTSERPSPPTRNHQTTEDTAGRLSSSHVRPVGGAESKASGRHQVKSEEDWELVSLSCAADRNQEEEELKQNIHEQLETQVKSKRRKRIQSPLMAAADGGGVPLSCKVCKVLRGSLNMLIKHSWSHVEDPERLCGVCGEQSESPEELRTHLESHKKTFSCDVCGKNFLSNRGLRSHAPLHTGEKPYECDICKKTFAIERTLKSHRLGHVEEKPHKCHVCQKSFAFKQLLMNHSRSHTGEKPYTCDLCGKSVSDFRSLSRHKMSHSGRKRYSYPFF